MQSHLVKSERGFTLIELIMVIVIVGILSSTAVPKFINLTDAANDAKCDANRGAMASAAAMVYAALVVSDPTQANWLEDATLPDLDDSMFASGAVPVCPTGGNYALIEGNVTCTIHGF